MGKATRMIAKIVKHLTGVSVADAVAENNRTAADLKDAVARARANVDAEIIEKEAEERKAAHAGQGG